MPYVTTKLSQHGAILDILVGIHVARQERLLAASFPVPTHIRIPAQIDTGSEFSTVDVRILQRLQINPIDEIDVRTPSTVENPQKFYCYPVCLSLDHTGERELLIPVVQVLGCSFSDDEGLQAMLGRDVLKNCLFVMDGKASTFSLAY